MSEAPESKPQTIATFDGRTADGAEVVDFYDPRCQFCDLGVLTRMVPVRPGVSAMAPRTDVCGCAIRRWQVAHPKENDGKASANPA